MVNKSKLSKDVEEQIQSLASDVYIQIEDKLTTLISSAMEADTKKGTSKQTNDLSTLEKEIHSLKSSVLEAQSDLETNKQHFQVELTQNTINFTETIESLENKLANLQQEKVKTKGQQKESSSQLEEKLLETEQALKDSKQEVDGLNGRIAVLTEQEKSLVNQMNTIKDLQGNDENKLKTSIDKLQQTNQAQNETLIKKQQQLEETISKLDKSTLDLKNMQKENKQSNDSKAQEIQAQVKQLTEQLQQEKESKVGLKQEFSKQLKQVEDKKEQEAQAQLKPLTEQLQQEKESKVSLKQEFSEQLKQVADKKEQEAQTQLKPLTEQLQQEKESKVSLKQEFSEQLKQVEDKKEQEAQAQLKQLTDKLQQEQESKSVVKKELTEQLQQEHRNKITLQEELTTLQKNVDTQQDQSKQLATKDQVNQEKIAELTAALAAEKDKHVKEKEAIIEKGKEAHKLQEIARKAIIQLETDKAQLAKQVATEQSDVQLYQQEVTGLKDQVKVAQEGQENILQRFNSNREKQDQDNEKVRETIKFLRDENHELLSANTEQKNTLIEQITDLEHKITEYRLKFEYAQKQLAN